MTPNDVPNLWAHSRARLIDRLMEIDASGRVAAEQRPYCLALSLTAGWLDDPRRTAVAVLWNTPEHLRSMRIRRGDPNGDSPCAWNWAFFARERRPSLWSGSTDPAGSALLREFAVREGMWCSDEEWEAADDELAERVSRLGDFLAEGIVTLIKSLHDEGEIAGIFGLALPVIVTSDDDHDPFPEWSRRANPPNQYARIGPRLEHIWSPG
jgi:hypothetical protein